MFAHKPERSIVLAAGLRSPWVRAGGAFAREDSAHLGARVARELLARTGVQTSFTPDAPGPWQVSLVVLSQPNCANPACADENAETITVVGDALPVTAIFTPC